MSEDHPIEQWRAVIGFPGYEVSDQGRVRSYRQSKLWARILKPGIQKTKGKYPRPNVALMRDGKANSKLVYHLVLEAFVGPCPDGMECRHLNGDSLDSRLGNLKWGTHRENGGDMTDHGRSQRGERAPWSKLTEDDVGEIRRLNKAGMMKKDIAPLFHVSRSTVSSICQGVNWKHVE